MFDVPHGQAVGVMLPHVIRFNAAEVEHQYRDLLHESQNGSPLAEAGRRRDGPGRFRVGHAASEPAWRRSCGRCGVDPLKLPQLAAAGRQAMDRHASIRGR